MAGFYNTHIMPRLVEISCGVGIIQAQRGMIIPQATGVVVEIGIGPGHNLKFYDTQKIKHLIGIDPVTNMTDLAKGRLGETLFDVEILNASAEDIPIDSNFADTVVLTYSACTIPLVENALSEECAEF